MADNNAINNKSTILNVDPFSSSDSWIQFDINTTGEFRIGVDDNAAFPSIDAFKISQGSAFGTNDTFIITAAGEITKPLNPAFLAVLDSTLSNVTGDGTSYTVVWDTEVFDQNGDFDGTSTFTSPITGRYALNATVMQDGLTSSNDLAYLYFITSNRNYFNNQINPVAIVDPGGQVSLNSSVLADMDAADTATVVTRAANTAKVVDLLSNGSADPFNWFSGYLQC